MCSSIASLSTGVSYIGITSVGLISSYVGLLSVPVLCLYTCVYIARSIIMTYFFDFLLLPVNYLITMFLHGNYLHLCFFSITIITVIISNTIPPIAPTTTGTIIELFAVLVVVVGGVDVIVEISEECNDVVYVVVDNTVVTVGKVVYDEPLELDAIIVKNNEILTILYVTY